MDVNTLNELMRGIALAKSGGYDTLDMDIQLVTKDAILSVNVTHTSLHDMNIIEQYTGLRLFGDFWFWDDGSVMQVL